MVSALTRKGSLIGHIHVRDLFGRYTYDLKLNSSADEKLTKLLILYGDNGSGKTTLLRSIFHLLAGEKGRGHKTYLAGIPFREISLELTDGTSVRALRSGEALKGAYQMVVTRDGKVLSQIEWKTDDEMVVDAKLQDTARQDHMLKTLTELDIDLYFLSDDREMEKSPETMEKGITIRADSDELLLTERLIINKAVLKRQGDERPNRVIEMEATVRRVSEWATGKAIAGSSKGDADSNAIYADIVQRLARPFNILTTNRPKLTKEALVGELEIQIDRSNAFSKYGLIGPINITPFMQAIKSLDEPMLATVQNVLDPYINSLRARLDALEPLHTAIDSFVSIVNSFYRDKSVQFDLQKGIRLQTSSGEELALASLSSGERQLLLLFCNVLVAIDRKSIFMIDEPELSLNIKWQRQLIDKLLDFTRNSSMQFIMATHSFELFSDHRGHVLSLSDVAGK
jgi:ABC-type cobalamin/Fe3+-siderophores transport system ATPase subunit